MNGRSALIVVAGLVALAALGIGCGPAAKQAPQAAVFYPSPPDAPRLQYLVTINDAVDWQPQARSSFADFIAGAAKTEDKPTEIRNPYGVAVHNGKIYVTDLGRFRVHVIDVINKGYATLGTSEQVGRPAGITIDTDGTKYVADTGKKQVVVFDAADQFVRAMGDPARCAPIAVAVFGGELFVADALGGKVEVWAKDGTLKRVISSKGNGPEQLQRPAGIAIGPQGQVYVSDMELSMIKVFGVDGHYIRTIGEPGDRPGYFARPKGVAVDPAGRIYVADTQWDKIQIFSPEGQLLLYFGESTRQPHGLVTPTGLAIDKSCLDAFRKYVSPDFEPEYLLLVANEFGINKISINTFGHARLAPGIAAPTEVKAPAAADTKFTERKPD